MAISVGDAVVEIGLDTKKLDSGLKGISGRLQQASQQWGRKMKLAGGAMIASVAAVGGVSLKMAADFDSAMREVNTMMLLSEEEFGGFSKQVQQLAKDMGVDAVKSAKALYQAISAGIPKENVLEFLEIATKAAIGGVTDTETAVDGLTTVINAFKLPMSDAQKVADIMFTTVKGGKTTFDELSASMFQVAPIAAASGVKFEEVAAALATMTKQGVPTKVATTQLRQAMVALQKPTTDMAKVIEDLGYESGQTMLEELGLAKTLATLRDATGGSNEMLMKMFGSVEAGAAVLALTGDNIETFNADLKAMEDASGAATDAFEQMEKSTSRQMAKMMAQLKDIGITIGNALMPALKSIMEIVGPIIKAIGDWATKNPKLIMAILGVIGALGGLLLAAGFLLPMISSFIGLLPILGGAFTLMLGPVGWVIAAIAALIAIGVLVWKNWDTIKEKATQIWNGIVRFFKGVWEKITGFFREHWDKILAILFPAVGLPILIARNWDKIIDVMKDIWRKIIDVFSGIWDTAKEWGMNLVKGLWEGIRSLTSWIWDKVTGFAKGIWENIKEGLGNLWPFSPSEAGVDIGKGLAEGIQAGVEGALKNVRSAMEDLAAEMLIDGGGIRPRMTLPAPISQMATPLAGETTIINNHFEGPWFIREEADIKKIARALYQMQQGKLAQAGL